VHCCSLTGDQYGVSSLAGGVVLVILAAIDAGFSGDWSRIGVLSKDAELGIRSLLGLLGLFHIVCGSVTALDATQKGYNPVPQTLKASSAPKMKLKSTCTSWEPAKDYPHNIREECAWGSCQQLVRLLHGQGCMSQAYLP